MKFASKYRNEIILFVCFAAGSVVAAIPNQVQDYAERASITMLGQLTPAANVIASR
jgi:hypothetical protein